MHPETLGERVAALRSAANISARALCRAIDVSQTMVSKIERSEIIDPGVSIVYNLATALGTTTEWLLFGKGRGPTANETLQAFAAFLDRKTLLTEKHSHE